MGQSVSNMLKRFGTSKARILMLGLDNTGKTTLLYLLKLGEIVTTVPTNGFNIEAVQYKRCFLTIWDVGGKTRPLWPMHFEGSDALILVIDSTDRERIYILRQQLETMWQSNDLNECPVLVYANKQDLPNAMSTSDIINELGLNAQEKHPWFVQDSSFIGAQGVHEGLEWLYKIFRK